MEAVSFDSILDEKAPVTLPAEQTEKPEPVVTPEAGAAPDEMYDYRSRKERAQTKEFEAQGLDRDPATGQWKKRTETVTPEAKPDVKTEAAPVVTQPELTAKEKAFYKEAMDERRKRQELERRFTELENKAPKEPDKSFFDDPDGTIAALRQEIKQATATTKLQTAEAIARSKYSDFDEKLAAFTELVQQTPGLMQQCVGDPNPAEFAYRLAKNHIELKQVGSMEEMRAKIERETETRVRAAVEHEFAAKQAALDKARASLPGSLSDARSTGINRPVWNGPESMEDILKG